MPLSALAQSSKSRTVAVVCSHACSKAGTRGSHDRRVYGKLVSRFHHLVIDRQQMRFSKGPATARTLFGFLPLAFSWRTTAMSSKVFKRGVHGSTPEIEKLYNGNKAYIANMAQTNPGLLQSLAKNGQKPPFMVVDCSDSRVNEQEIFSAEPGTLFTAGNIANQFDEDDLNSNAVLSFAVDTLKVKHVIVMGHYGCGGIAASMVPPPGLTSRSGDLAVQNWIFPIRRIYERSIRPEIVAHRTNYANTTASRDSPDLHDPAFRALVEENVKANVIKIAKSSVMQQHYSLIAQAKTTPNDSEKVTGVYIHGWVYDVESGQVSDLGVSVGPPGKVVPRTPFPTIKPSDGKRNLESGI